MPGRLRNIVRFLRRRRYLAIWTAGLVTIAVLIVGAFSSYSPLERLDNLVFDAYQNLQPRAATESPAVVVDIDDESIRILGQWPWSRTVLADLIDRLTQMGAAAIALDIILAEPDRTSPEASIAQLTRQGFKVTYPDNAEEFDHDRLLAQSFSRSPVVAGLVLAESARMTPPKPKSGFAFGGANPVDYLPGYDGSLRNLPILDDAASGIGMFNFPPARDGVVRQIPLVSRVGGGLYPALSVEALRVAQGASGYAIRSTGAAGEQDTGNPGMIALKTGAYEAPTTADGKIWVYYSDKRSTPVIPAYSLLSKNPEPALQGMVEGRIVLVGTSAIGLRDLVSTPIEAGVAGVMVHAEIIDQIVHEAYITRPDWAIGFEVAAAVGLSLALLLVLPWFSTLGNALLAGNFLALSVAGGWIAFTRYHLLLSPILTAQCCLLVYGIASGVRLLLSERESRYIRGAFSHYLAPSMVKQLVDNPQSLILGGENRELTLLFCDIRSFTSLAEGLGPVELTEFLNKFLTPMTDVLMANGATIDKYMGDAIMAFWNAPLDVADHRRKACECVLQMQAALKLFNETLTRPVKVGIGLNTGICCVGNLGSRQRFDYSAIGDPVNVASRIEGLTKFYGLSNLVSEHAVDSANHLAVLEIDWVQLVGKDAAIRVYSILGGEAEAGGEGFAALRERHDRFLTSYRARDFAFAKSELDHLKDAGGPMLERVYAEYESRLALFARAPPPPEWRGVYRAESK